jgi:hypothetical protein
LSLLKIRTSSRLKRKGAKNLKNKANDLSNEKAEGAKLEQGRSHVGRTANTGHHIPLFLPFPPPHTAKLSPLSPSAATCC